MERRRGDTAGVDTPPSALTGCHLPLQGEE